MAEYPYKYKHKDGAGDGTILAEDKAEAKRLVNQLLKPQYDGDIEYTNLKIEVGNQLKDESTEE